MTTLPSVRTVSPNRLRFALSTAYDDAITHFARYGTPPSGPFALALYDLAPPTDLTLEDFGDTQLVLDAMRDRLVTFYGTPGYDQPIEGGRYAVPGRENLSVLEITRIKAAEILVTGASNLELLHAQQKWPGACASFGGRPMRVSAGDGNIWPLAIAGSGYKPWFDQRITDGAIANVQYELIETGDVPTEAVESDTFLLGACGSWSYPNATP